MSGLNFVPAPLAQLPWKIILLVLAIGMFRSAGALFGGGRPHAALGAVAGYPLLRLPGRRGGAVARPGTRLERDQPSRSMRVLIILLILVELIGAVRGGGQRWLDLGFIRLQPSELMKPCIVLALRQILRHASAQRDKAVRRDLAGGVADRLIPAALVMMQPDLGTALMITVGGVTVMFLAGVPLRLFIGGALALGAAVPLAVNFVLHDYQRNRILIFLNPESDPLGIGYHISQSKIAIGSGGIFGKGFLNGTQSHLDYLPEGHTDFVLATMMEEWGLVGGVLLILAFFVHHPLGHDGRAARPDPLRPIDGGGPGDDDLLLRRDQPGDGDGPGAGRRHPPPPDQLRRLGADDGDDVPRRS